MSRRKAVSRLVHRGHIPDHTWRVRRAHRARRAAERDFCHAWQPGDEFDPAVSGRGKYRPNTRCDKSGNPVRKEAFYGLLRQMVGLDWDTIKVKLTRRFGNSNLGRRSLRSLFSQIEQGKTPFTVETKYDGVVLCHDLGSKPQRQGDHYRPNQRFVDDWDEVLVDDFENEDELTELGLSVEEAEAYEREYQIEREDAWYHPLMDQLNAESDGHWIDCDCPACETVYDPVDFDHPYYDEYGDYNDDFGGHVGIFDEDDDFEDEDDDDSYDDICLCDDCRDERASKLEAERLEWEERRRQAELDAQIDDSGPENFGFPEPRRGMGPKRVIRTRPNGPQWAKHKPPHKAGNLKVRRKRAA